MEFFRRRHSSLFLLILILATLLRIAWLGIIPASLYTDEANQGYNAYSVMLTGRDEHGNFLPVSLRSFGDWKPPLPTYLMIPFIWMFGLSEITVRLPSVILGIGTIIITFHLIKLLFENQKGANAIALLNSFFLTISPWHILQSRAAMLVMVGLFFLELGIFLFIRGVKDTKFFLFSSISFSLSIYSYYGLRVITPMLVIFLLISYRNQLRFLKDKLIQAGLFGVIIIAPLLITFIKHPDVVFGRAKTVSIFYDQGVNLRKWELISQDGFHADTSISRLFHNNFYMYGRSIIQRFLSHLDGRYLIMTGDQSQPFQIPKMGILYFPDLFFFLVGLIILFKYKYRHRNLIIFWIFASIIPAAFTFITPASNRSFNTIPVYMVLIAIGSIYIIKKIQGKVLIAIFITIFYIYGLGYFMHQYFISLPLNHGDWWNYGWKQVVEYVNNQDIKYKNIVAPDLYGMPYIYFLFYEKYLPGEFHKNAIRPYIADRFGFEHVEGFDKYLFPSEFDWHFIKRNNLQKKSLYIIPASQALEDKDYIKAIYYPNGKIAFKIFAYE